LEFLELQLFTVLSRVATLQNVVKELEHDLGNVKTQMELATEKNNELSRAIENSNSQREGLRFPSFSQTEMINF
tara:strand:+ start:2897 stop:3118 length:222 start_codon:yes stop_codon:yes gene_type:complete